MWLRLSFPGPAVMLIAWSAICPPARAQIGSSSISGFVYDPSHTVVPGAQVVLVNPSTGLRREIETSESGYYKFPALEPGTYQLRALKQGFQDYAARDLILLVAQDLAHDITLQVGATTQEITVTANVQMLDSESATVGQVIGARQIVELPLNGRNFLQLASLSSGANPTVLQGSPASFATSVENRPNITVILGGNRESGGSYLLDGIEMRNDRVGALSFQPSIDAIAEFKVERSFFQAENGFHPGIVNVVTKSGTNGFHGSAWEFVRNSEFDARNFFSPGTEPFRQNQFGVTAGGPILKDKLFFMVDYEGMRQRLGLLAQGIYPTVRQFSGDLSEPFNQPIFDPATFDPATGLRQPFPGNVIPASRINPFSTKAVKMLFPVVTAPPTGINIRRNPVQKQTDDQFIGRLDMPNLKLFGRHTQFVFRYAHGESDQLRPGLAPFQTLSRPLYPRNVLAQFTTGITPRTIHVLRLGYQRDWSPYTWEGSRGTLNIPLELGIKNTTTNPIDYAAPNFSLVGFSGTGGSYNLQTVTNRYVLADNMTHIRGRHTLKGGFEIRYVRLLEETSTFSNGNLTFNGQFSAQTQPGAGGVFSLAPRTGSPVADFLLGFPQAGSAAYGNTLSHFRFTQFGFFMQDDWKVSRDLTFQLGLRYEPSTYPAPEELNNYLFDQNTGTVLFPRLGELPPGLLTLPHRELGPRAGLAWAPRFDRKSTWRAGYGIYFDLTQLNEMQFQNFGPPFYNLQSFSLTGSQVMPVFELGRNTFPDVTPPPIQKGFLPPAGTGPFSLDPGNRTPTVYQWNVNYQRQLGSNWLLEAGYFGLHGLHLSKRYDINTCSSAADLRCDPARKRFPRYSQVFLSTTNGWSRYNGLHLRLEKRFSGGLQLLGGYTWQKSLDTDSGGAFGSPTQRAACLNCDKGLSNFNINHRFTLSTIYELPLGRGRAIGRNISKTADRLAGGWQISGITSFQTGPPQDITALNLAGDAGIHTHRANCLGLRPYASGDLRSNGMQWLNPANYAQPGSGLYGTCGRSAFTGPGLNNWDLSLSKRFPLTETAHLDVRAELFNAFNHAQFDLPVGSVASPLFGRVIAAERPRVVQLGLKLQF